MKTPRKTKATIFVAGSSVHGLGTARLGMLSLLLAGVVGSGLMQQTAGAQTTSVAVASTETTSTTIANGSSSTSGVSSASSVPLSTTGSSSAGSSTTVGSSLVPAATGPTIANTASSTPLAGQETTTLPPTATTPTTTIAAFVPGRTLRVGMKGDDVLALEERLDLLKFQVGPIDGKFDFETWQGVMAFQKLNGLPRTAKFDAKTQKLFAQATTPGGVIPNGGLPRVEVDITRQVLLYFDKYGLAKVIAISSGSGKSYCSLSPKTKAKVCGDAKTPRGNFKIQRRISGKRESDLGTLLNPIYFTGGFAIHGSPSVPAGPASHGCVRVTNKFSQWVFDNIKNGTPVYLFD